ncbi:hypothetical protein NW762_006221 [Fusarium torreyae]|uniref:lytic cellulose monooxygenase (C4-dehydrogenating) n=1 Tax=Fusarium torreyae TaxID=1237075 RepID=A0A9W8S3K2_9HYPO|nr:hypothetical protein NW762_006221 [Fusarium torreyae]
MKAVSIAPGDILGFTVNIEMSHPGSLTVYMSKTPEALEAQDYNGDGIWFKIYATTVTAYGKHAFHWAEYKYDQAIRNYTFELPHRVPPGQYLLRAEHIGIHDSAGFAKAQFYISCAQLEVTGKGRGKPSLSAKIPGVYNGREPGILIDFFNPIPTNHDVPGPVTWPLACENSAKILGETWDGDCGWSDVETLALGRKHTRLW